MTSILALNIAFIYALHTLTDNTHEPDKKWRLHKLNPSSGRIWSTLQLSCTDDAIACIQERNHTRDCRWRSSHALQIILQGSKELNISNYNQQRGRSSGIWGLKNRVREEVIDKKNFAHKKYTICHSYTIDNW